MEGRGDRLLQWQLIDTGTWAVHSLSVVPVIRFVGGSQPATGLMGQGSRPVDLPKYDQLTQIIGVRKPWQLQYDEQWEQLFMTCESSGRALFSAVGAGLLAGLRGSWGQLGAAVVPSPTPQTHLLWLGPNQPSRSHWAKASSERRWRQKEAKIVSRDVLVVFFSHRCCAQCKEMLRDECFKSDGKS